ncbi:anion permease [Clostridium magnum]|uniref:anion permease n=1 Tax=Clostridium magnum TaxID=33954 RepID=UPI00082CA847|nr:anion permease [Clostridium magnum]
MNLLAISTAKALGVSDNITFGNWLLLGVVPSLVSFIVIPLVIYLVCPPDIKEMDNVNEIMDKKLKELGKVKKSEKIMIFVFTVVVVFGSWIKLDSTSVAVLGLIIIVSTGVVSLEGIHSLWRSPRKCIFCSWIC